MASMAGLPDATSLFPSSARVSTSRSIPPSPSILALHAFVDGKAGPLVLLLGLARYGFVVAGLVFPWLNRTLPERFSRKVICVVQLVALIALQLPFVTPPFSTLLVVATVAAVLWSFGRDVIWLRRSKA